MTPWVLNANDTGIGLLKHEVDLPQADLVVDSSSTQDIVSFILITCRLDN